MKRKKASSRRVFIDTSFFKALVDQEDGFHNDSLKILEKLESESYEFVTSNYILDETYTLIRTRCGLEDAILFHDGLGSGLLNLTLLRVETDDEILAWKLFQAKWSKLSFTDCTSFALMKRINMNEVATFDKHFSRAGFIIFK